MKFPRRDKKRKVVSNGKKHQRGQTFCGKINDVWLTHTFEKVLWEMDGHMGSKNFRYRKNISKENKCFINSFTNF